ncbi:MAG: endonuclease domain-containing protein [Anaerolineae bacterium]|nr:endonuclease domain-containing protein [Anaerolineae bacterium]
MKRQPMRAGRIVRQRAKELRQAGTSAENLLWERLRDRQLHGLKFRRQHPIGRGIVDFCCAEAGLILEVDGGIHTVQREWDLERTALLEAQGYRVIRFGNEAVVGDIDAVLAEIAQAARGEPSPSPRAQTRVAPPSPGGQEREGRD